MALFTDGMISEIQDLLAYESNLTEVGEAEGIDLTSKLQLAQSELGAELAAAALSPGNIYWTGRGWHSTGSEANLSRFDLGRVVVTPPLKLWHSFQALSIVYRDAYNRKLNDKYRPKWNEYKELARWASNLLYTTGLGLTLNPIPRPAKPAVDWVTGTLAAMTLYVRITWIGSGGAEGAASETVAVETPSSTALRVTPPAGAGSSTGWNVYAGGAAGEESRQNSAPLVLGQSWTMPGTGLASGAAVGTGQAPDLFKAVPRFVPRG